MSPRDVPMGCRSQPAVCFETLTWPSTGRWQNKTPRMSMIMERFSGLEDIRFIRSRLCFQILRKNVMLEQYCAQRCIQYLGRLSCKRLGHRKSQGVQMVWFVGFLTVRLDLSSRCLKRLFEIIEKENRVTHAFCGSAKIRYRAGSCQAEVQCKDAWPYFSRTFQKIRRFLAFESEIG